jgi:hypothetical protein
LKNPVGHSSHALSGFAGVNRPRNLTPSGRLRLTRSQPMPAEQLPG